MGFMDLFTKKKKVSSKDEMYPYRSSMELLTNRNLYDTLAAFVAAELSSLNLTEEASLKSFGDDKGLLDSFVFSATVAPAYTKLKERSKEEYLGVCGSNAFGRGIYAAGMQNELNKPISQFTRGEVDEIIEAFRYSAGYELGLKMIKVEAGSEKHKAAHDLIVHVANYYLENCSEPLEEDNLRSYLQALFNAGVSVIYR